MFEITREGVIFPINNFPWDENGAKPETEVTVYYDDCGYKVSFKSYEENIRAVETKHNSPVHEDSCMEFFAAFLNLAKPFQMW